MLTWLFQLSQVAELASLLRDVLLDDSVDRQNHWKVYKSE